MVEKGAKVDGIVGRWGNDKITVKDTGTVVTENIEGNEDGDTIKILDGARVKGYVSGGRGENPSIYGGAEKSDKDNITIENSIVEGDVEGGDKSGNDGVKIANSHIGGKVYGGYGENTIEITEGTNNNVRWAQGNKFNDEITVKGNAKLNDTHLLGEAGNDTITIKDNAQIKGGNIDTGAGADDKININGNAEIEGTTLQLGASGESTDRATLNVTENAVLKGVLIQASQSSGEQLMNFHQSGEAKVKSLMGSQNKDVIDIAGDFTYTNVGNNLQTHGGDDEIKMHSGATVKVKADMGDGNDTVNVRGGTFSEAGIGLGKGKNEVNIESGAVFGDQNARLNALNEHKTSIKSDHRASQNSEDTINVKTGATVKNAEIQTYGGEDTLNVDGSIINSNVDMGECNDTVSISKNASIDGSSTIDGGAGIDTLKIADGSIDFSRVKNFEKLDLTQGDHNVTLSAKDVLDMTDNNNKLRIDGDGNDKVDIDSSFTQKPDLIEGGVTYHRYEATYTDSNGSHTVTLEIKDQVQVL